MIIDDEDDEKEYAYSIGGTSATGRQKGKPGGGKSSAFKPPKPKAVPKGGGGKVHIKLSGGKGKVKAPSKVASPKPAADQKRALVNPSKSGASRRFLPAGAAGPRSGPKSKRKTG
jgi:hypothetical protein